jgi:two-component system chemotaxis sensor kinase CheA
MQDSYRELFLTESEEFLSNISNFLVKLEENPDDNSAINEIFRCVHTLKGMAATMGYEKLARLAHQMEDLLDVVRNHQKKISPEIMDALFLSVDLLQQLFLEIKDKGECQSDVSAAEATLKRLLEQPVDAVSAAPAGSTPVAGGVSIALSADQIKRIKELEKKYPNVFFVMITLVKDCAMKEARAFLVTTNIRKFGEIIHSVPSFEDLKNGKFDLSFGCVLATSKSNLDLQQELAQLSDVAKIDISPVAVNASADPSAGKAPAVSARPAPAASGATQFVKKIQSMRIPVERLDKIMNLMGELAIARIRLLQIVQSYKMEALEEVSFSLDRLISALQDEVMQTRLLPVAYILDAFPRVVRDIARKASKEVDLQITGGEIELDRVVLDEMSDPLLHLVRNSLDHGLETVEERKAKGKNPKGRLFINVSRQKGQIYIEVGDDGKGVDFNKVRATALNKGLLTEEIAAGFDEKRILDLLTLPGFSTKDKITDISGRGVGLDVVKSRIEYLGGRVDFETQVDVGSKFILTLPLTLAIIKAMLVQVHNEIFAIPLISIRETIKINPNDIKFVQNYEVVKVRDEIIPIIRLDKELGIESSAEDVETADSRISLVIVEYGKKALALTVSCVIGEQDIAVKPLGAMIKRTKGIQGATILGDGRVALILDIMSLK